MDINEYIFQKLIAIEAANRLMKKIEHTILILERNPYICPKVKIKPHNNIYRKLVVGNYIVLYDIEEKYKQVVIYRIVYGKKDYLKIED